MRVSLKHSGRLRLIGIFVAGVALVGCAQSPNLGYDVPPTKSEYRAAKTMKQGGVFGQSGVMGGLFGNDKAAGDGTGAPIPVNSFLWRATLDTLSFMPLASADPFGGVIITDWFSPPESTNERFKMTVYILSRDLRADGLRVAVFRQLRDATGNWVDGEASAETSSKLENTILTRARELRIASIAQ